MPLKDPQKRREWQKKYDERRKESRREYQKQYDKKRNSSGQPRAIRLSDAGVSHLTCLTQLRDVELRHNRFSTGVALLCLPNIRKLDLSWTLLPYEQLQSVCSTLQDLSLCKSLRYFIWTGFAFTFEQKAALREATDRRQLSLVVVVD